MSFDLEAIKNKLNIVEIVSQTTPLKKSGKNFVGMCPFHENKKTPAFVVFPDIGAWKCYGTCAEGGDVIKFLMKRDGLTFRQVCEQYGDAHAVPAVNSKRREVVVTDDEPPTPEWQRLACDIVYQGIVDLYSESGAKAMHYLRTQRLLKPNTIQAHRLGFVPEDKKVNGVFVPRGILIPTFVDGALWAVHIRKASGKPKYVHLTGSRKSLFGSNHTDRRMVVMCGGEFDAMLLQQECAWRIGACSPSTGEGSAWSATWCNYLMSADVIISAYDSDEAGQNGAFKKVFASTARAVIEPPPSLNEGDKDITDYARSGGSLADWVTEFYHRHTAHDDVDQLEQRLESLYAERFKHFDYYCDLKYDYESACEAIGKAPRVFSMKPELELAL